MEDILEKIYKSTLRFLIPLNLEETYRTITHEAVKLVGADSGVLYLEEGGEFKAVYSTVPEMYDIRPRSNANTYKAFTTLQPILADISDVGSAHPELKKLRLKGALFIPLSNDGEAIGVLTVNTKKEHFFDERTMKILVLFGSMVTMAIRKAHLYQEIKQALDTRDLFISMASHELRTPLTSVNGYIQLLHSRLAPKGGEEARWIDHLSWEAERLTSLVKELLAIEQIRSGDLHYFWKEADLKEIVERALDNFRFTHENYKTSFSCDSTAQSYKVVGDFDKLLQALTNLLDNAANSSPAGSEIKIKLKKKAGFNSLEIKDSGYGIPQKDLAKVFDRFHRASNSSREGMGLGLFLVKDIVTRHRGTIQIKSRLNKGTTVTVNLPSRKII